MDDIRVGDLVRLKQDVTLTRLRGRIGIVRGIKVTSPMLTWVASPRVSTPVANIKHGHFGVQFERTLMLAVYLDEIAAVKRGGQWLTQVDGVWSA